MKHSADYLESKMHSAPRMHLYKTAALVKKTRVAKHLSLRDVSEGTKLSHQQILRIEKGICSIEAAARVLRALHISKKTVADVLVDDVRRFALAS